MRLLSEMTFYTTFNGTHWEVRDIQEDGFYGMFLDKAEAFEYCRELNE